MTLLVGLSVVSLACGSSALLVQVALGDMTLKGVTFWLMLVALGVAGITVLP
jgi:hypothetical protein